MNIRELMRLAVVTVALVCPSIASAGYVHVMTFDGLGEHDPQQAYVEDGITADASGLLGSFCCSSTTSPHLDRAGPWANSISFTTGSLFTAESVMIHAAGSGYCADGVGWNCEYAQATDPIPYIWFSGYAEGVLVGSVGLFRPASTEWEQISLGFLGQIDLLQIEVKNFLDIGWDGSCDRTNGCGHFDIDNVTLQSVPEPGTLALLGLGLAGIGAIRRRRANA